MGKATAIHLRAEDRQTLEGWTRAGTTERRYAERARFILPAAEGATTTEIAWRFSVRAATVSKWRQRFAEQGVAGLQDAPRPGRPRRYGREAQRRVLQQLDEEPPEGQGS